MEPTSAPDVTKSKPQPKVPKPKAEKPKATEADLDQDKGKHQKGKGPVGSRENPEVSENVPGHVIPILAASTASGSPTCR